VSTLALLGKPPAEVFLSLFTGTNAGLAIPKRPSNSDNDTGFEASVCPIAVYADNWDELWNWKGTQEIWNDAFSSMFSCTGSTVVIRDLTTDFISDSRAVGVLQIREDVSAAVEPVNMLAEIRANLSLNVTELAEILKVERPTIYSWMDGKSPRAAKTERLHDIYRIAMEWRKKSALPIGDRVRRSSPRESSLVKLLKRAELPHGKISQLLDSLARSAKRKEGAKPKTLVNVDALISKHKLAPVKEPVLNAELDTLKDAPRRLE